MTLSASSGTITLGCSPGQVAGPNCNVSPNQTVQLAASATDPDGDTLLYTYSTTGGRITGDGANVTWDLSGVQPGTYTSTVEVDDRRGCVAFSSTTVTVAECEHCVPPCPTVSISCPTEQIAPGTSAIVSVNVSGGDPNASVTYNWTVSAGTISSGQGTSSITIDTIGASGSVTATVEIGGLTPECDRTRSCSFNVAAPPAKCPTVEASSPSTVKEGEQIKFTAGLRKPDTSIVPSYNWSFSDGTTINSQGAPTVLFNTVGKGGQSITATVTVGGYPLCDPKEMSASSTTKIEPQPKPDEEHGPQPNASPTPATPQPSASPNQPSSAPLNEKIVLRYPLSIDEGGNGEIEIIYSRTTEEVKESRVVNGNQMEATLAPLNLETDHPSVEDGQRMVSALISSSSFIVDPKEAQEGAVKDSITWRIMPNPDNRDENPQLRMVVKLKYLNTNEISRTLIDGDIIPIKINRQNRFISALSTFIGQGFTLTNFLLFIILAILGITLRYEKTQGPMISIVNYVNRGIAAAFGENAVANNTNLQETQPEAIRPEDNHEGRGSGQAD